MKNIIDVYEASLLDLDGTFEEGDNFEKEFKEAIKIIKNNIANSNYLQDLEIVKSEFMKHVTYIKN